MLCTHLGYLDVRIYVVEVQHASRWLQHQHGALVSIWMAELEGLTILHADVAKTTQPLKVHHFKRLKRDI